MITKMITTSTPMIVPISPRFMPTPPYGRTAPRSALLVKVRQIAC